MRTPFDTTTSLPSLPSASVTGDPIAAADSGLSAAVRSALGSGHDAAHLAGRIVKTGQELARRAKTDKPSPRNAAPRKGHAGPRSGHK